MSLSRDSKRITTVAQMPGTIPVCIRQASSRTDGTPGLPSLYFNGYLIYLPTYQCTASALNTGCMSLWTYSSVQLSYHDEKKKRLGMGSTCSRPGPLQATNPSKLQLVQSFSTRLQEKTNFGIPVHATKSAAATPSPARSRGRISA